MLAMELLLCNKLFCSSVGVGWEWGSQDKSDEPICEACHPSCVECRGPGMWNCTACPALQILSDDGRCLSCCGNETRHRDKLVPRECCDCTVSLGKSQRCHEPQITNETLLTENSVGV